MHATTGTELPLHLGAPFPNLDHPTSNGFATTSARKLGLSLFALWDLGDAPINFILGYPGVTFGFPRPVLSSPGLVSSLLANAFWTSDTKEERSFQ